MLLFKRLFLAAAVVVSTASSASAVSFTFSINPALSNVDLTLSQIFAGTTVITTDDTQTMPVSGNVTLDVGISGSTVTSVDFISLELDYDVDVNNQTTWNVETLLLPGLPPVPDPFEIRLPFDPAQASGSPITPVDPSLELTGANAGTETGTLGDLLLTSPTFTFEGTAQLFGSPLATDGFPSDLGPYPAASTFPGAPPGPNSLDGSVTLVGNVLTFDADFLSIGTGGGGTVQTTQVHDGSFSATAIVPEPATGTLLLGGLVALAARRRH